MTKLILLAITIALLSSCGTHYTISSTKEFNVTPTTKFIVRLTDTDLVIDTEPTTSTIELLQSLNYKVMPVHEFDSINYRFILHLNDSWEPTPEELQRLHRYVDYDYLLVGGFSEYTRNFHLYHKQTDRERELNLNLPKESTVEFKYYLYSIREHRLALYISVRKTASGNAFAHAAFGSLILPKALKKLKKYLQE